MRHNGKYGVYIILPVVLAALIAGCGGKPASGENPSTQVSASATAAVLPTPTPIPTPTPTEPPKGTLVNGWVAGIPDYVPCFSCGSIDKNRSSIVEGSISTVFELHISGVQREDVAAYFEALEEGGYKVAAGEIGNTYTLIAAKDMGYGEVTLVITLNEADGSATYALEAPV